MVAINNVPAQSGSYSNINGRLLNDLVHDVRETNKVALLLKVQCEHLSYRLVRSTEGSKIAPSDQTIVTTAIPFISDTLATGISQHGPEAALNQPLVHISERAQLVLDDVQEKPDVIYLTSSNVRSLLIKKALAQQLPRTPTAGGDSFGSVIAGLARWTDVVFH